jgi:quercetin dioxygenase-like cupin family protein
MIMRRLALLLSLVGLLLLGAAAPEMQPVTRAQGVTPVPGIEPEGVIFEPLAITSGVTLASPADIIAVRLRIEPGAGFPLETSDPTGGMVIVESGTFTVRVDAPWAITRSGSALAAIATAEATGTYTPPDEQISSGEEVTMGAGDAAYIPGSVSGEIRNDGDEPAVAHVVLIGPTEGMTGATPTP